MAKKKTSMFPDQPAENNIHAGEEVVVVEKPSATPSTSVDGEAAEDAREEPDIDEFAISPYACAPVVIDCGPGLASYQVPKHLLRSPKWSTTDAGGIVQLSDVSAATGHTLVHYLYTGTYQSLETKGKDAASPAHIKFEQALMAFILASAYELPDFERLAKEQIDMIGGSMTLDEVLHTAKKWFPKMARSWFHEYLQTRAKEQFSLDYRYFTHRAYIENVGDGKLQSFMAHFLLDIFARKLTHTLQRGESLDEERAEVVVDGVEDAASQSEVSFEFVDASREDTVAVISLGDQAWDETTHVPRESTPMPSPGPLTESEAQPKLAPGLPPAEEEWVGHKENEEGEWLAKEAEEEVERKRKEEEEAAAAADAAAAASKAADLRWANETPANDDWGSFAATTTGKKKKGKKGKAKPTPPTPPPPAEPPTTFDDIKLDDVNLDDGAPKIGMNFSDPGAAKSGSGFGLGCIGGWSSGWGSSNKTSRRGGLDDSSKDAGGNNPWGSDKKESSAFDFDFEAFQGSSEAAPPAEEKPPEDDGWGFGATTTKKKKGKNGALIEESIPEPEPAPAAEPVKKEEDDPWAFSFESTGKDKKKKKGAVEESPPEPEPEPEPVREPTPPPPEPEPEPVKDEPAVDPFAGLSKSQKKKLQEKMKKEAKAKEEEDAKRKEEQEAAEDVRQTEEAEAERIRLEEEEEAEKKRLEEEEAAAAAAAAAEAEKKNDDTCGDWGAMTTTSKKKKKGAVEEEPPPPPPPEPEPEPAVEPEPESEPVPEPEFVKEDDPWGFAATTCKKKKKKKGIVEEEPPPPPPPPEPEPLVEPEPSPPAEEKPANGWDDWGAATTTTKKKKKKDVVEEEPPPPPPEPEPETVIKPEPEPIPEPEPVEDKNDGGDWGFSSIWGGGKKKMGLKKDTRVEEEEKPGTEVVAMEEEERMHESIPEVSRVLCPHRSYHFAEVDGWKSCERCRTMIRAFAAQLEKDEKAVTLL